MEDNTYKVSGFFLRPKNKDGNHVLWGASQFFHGIEWEYNGCLIVLSKNIDGFMKSLREYNKTGKKPKVEYDLYPLPGMED